MISMWRLPLVSDDPSYDASVAVREISLNSKIVNRNATLSNFDS